MQSDAEGMRRTGGAVPEPKPFAPAFSPPAVPDGRQVGGRGVTGLPPAPVSQPDAGGHGKTVLLIVGLLVVAGALGAAGYFFAWPLFFSVPTTPATPPITEQSPVIPPTGDVPETPVQPTTPVSHASLFTTEPPLPSTPVTVPDGADAASLRTLLGTAAEIPEAERAAANGSIREIAFLNADGNPASFSRIFSALIPDVDAATLDALFEQDFTSFVYYDANGVWPGYVAKLKDGVSETAAQNQIAKLEQSQSLPNLYATPPTGAASVFKDGSVGARPARYLSFATKGASLNYAWLNNHLVVSTSYTGIKAAATLLGF
ncbi:MAG: hypothetical protein HYS43_01355 [Candidatus Liptonbacteria bacterium]|nr:hypothetical protein [Candidatus Liptonbacteria bacterium]